MPRVKTAWKPGNLVLPAPAALVSCQAPGEKPNLITVAWCGNVNSNPPMASISLMPCRHSFGIIDKTGEFVINLPSRDQAWAVDYCGVVSGRDADKFAAAGLTPFKAGKVSCPGVEECPVNISCRVVGRHELGSHFLFIARVEEVAVNADAVDAGGAFIVEKARLLCYAHGFYFSLGKRMGHFGWSVRKKPAAARNARKISRK